MFREMRRKRQLLSQVDTQKVLYEGTSGVLAVSGDDGYPYAVSLSYVYDGQKIYFHSAKSGHKLDSIPEIRRRLFVLLTRIRLFRRSIQLISEASLFLEQFVFWRMKQKREAIEKLADKYAPDDTAENRKRAIEREWRPLCMLEMTPEYISGKEAIELYRQRKP